jgi:VWFA-related protein
LKDRTEPGKEGKMTGTKNWMRFWCAALLIAMLAAPGGAAQAEGSLALYLDWVDVGGFPQAVLHMAAWDNQGRPLTGLQAADFMIQEDDLPPVQAMSLETVTDAPLWATLVIDVSTSMNGKPLEDAKNAAVRFLDRMDKQQDHVAIVAFSDALDPAPSVLDPKRESDFTNDLAGLMNLVDGLEAGGQTYLYDAAAKGVGLFNTATEARHRAVLLLSDGRNEPAGQGDAQQAIALAKANHVPFYVIGLGSPANLDVDYLQGLAFDTGGLYLGAPSSAQLGDLFDQMGVLLKTRYRLSYISGLQGDGQTHRIRVTLKQQGATALAEMAQVQMPKLVAPTQIVQAPTFTPAPPTNTPAPPTFTPQAIEPAAAAPVEPPKPPSGTPVWLYGGLVAALAVMAAVGMLLRRKPTAHVFCKVCGYERTNIPGPCPQCKDESAPIEKPAGYTHA